jgi:arylamine N-acetyltransferase
MHDFAEKHTFLSTSPESGFVKLLSVQRRDADGADVMVGLVFRRVDGEDPAPPQSLTDRNDWFDVLTDVFHLRLDGAEPEAIDRLWDTSLAAHRAWEEKQAGKPR